MVPHRISRIERLSRLLFERIKREVPEARMETCDFGWTHVCYDPAVPCAVYLYRVRRPGQERFRLRKRDIGAAVAMLKEAA